MTQPDLSTRDKILDAAEQLFGSQGFAETSLRAIMKSAGVNMASIHYHFGSREALIEEMIVRLADPINRDRLDRLDRLEADHPAGPLPAEAVIEAFLTPVFKALDDPSPSGSRFPRLMGRLIMESRDELQGVMGRVFAEVATRFVFALTRALPHLPQDEVVRRLHFMIGAMVFSIVVPHPHSSGELDTSEKVGTSRRHEALLAFAVAGMQAPGTTSSTET